MQDFSIQSNLTKMNEIPPNSPNSPNYVFSKQTLLLSITTVVATAMTLLAAIVIAPVAIEFSVSVCMMGFSLAGYLFIKAKEAFQKNRGEAEFIFALKLRANEHPDSRIWLSKAAKRGNACAIYQEALTEKDPKKRYEKFKLCIKKGFKIEESLIQKAATYWEISSYLNSYLEEKEHFSKAFIAEKMALQFESQVFCEKININTDEKMRKVVMDVKQNFKEICETANYDFNEILNYIADNPKLFKVIHRILFENV